MRSLWRQLVTCALVLTLLPGWVEVLENLEHLIHDGHLAHVVEHGADEDHASHDALAAEHGCTPISHSCGCHISIPAVLPAEFDLTIKRHLALKDRRPTADDTVVSRANAPPVPPPTA